MDTPTRKLTKVPVYEVRLVQSRRPLRLAEARVPDVDFAFRTLHALIATADREQLAAVFINARQQVTGVNVVAIGGQHTIDTVEVRTVFRAAIAACASAIILGHNHPSGDPAPSDDDIATTRKLMAAGDLLGIVVLDHIIVTKDKRRWHSMAGSGTLPKA